MAKSCRYDEASVPGIAPRSPRPLPAARSPCGIRCARSRPWLPPGLRHATHCRYHLRACDLSSRERSSPADTVAHLLVDLPARPDAPASGRHSVSESSVRVLGASGFSRTLTRYSECGRPCPRAGQEAHVRDTGLGLARAGPRVCCGSLRSNCVGWGAWPGCYGGPIASRTGQRVAGRQKGAAGPIQRMSPAA